MGHTNFILKTASSPTAHRFATKRMDLCAGAHTRRNMQTTKRSKHFPRARQDLGAEGLRFNLRAITKLRAISQTRRSNSPCDSSGEKQGISLTRRSVYNLRAIHDLSAECLHIDLHAQCIYALIAKQGKGTILVA